MQQFAFSSDSFDPTMLVKVREILLTQYIGSILVALMLWQAGFEIIRVAVRTAFWLFDRQRVSVLGASRRPAYDWNAAIFSGVSTALYLLTAYALVRWLYPTHASKAKLEDNEGRSNGTEQ